MTERIEKNELEETITSMAITNLIPPLFDELTWDIGCRFI
jgi:hypothetical protein